jgi:hypothetical protein
VSAVELIDAGLSAVFAVECASQEDQFLAFVVEYARLRDELGGTAFRAAVDELLAESPAVTS